MKTCNRCLKVLVFFFACGTSAFSWSDAGPEDVGKSWDSAVVHVPGKLLSTKVDRVQVDKPMPVVLLMHGCNGLQKTESAWAGFLKDKGYIVVLPDSFARSRPQSCDPRTKRGGMFPGVVKFRHDEVRYAFDRLALLPWVDQRNIFLMGHSEGGRVVALYGGTGFRGAVISAWLCNSLRFPENNGLRLPENMAILAIDHERDSWYPDGEGRHCGEYFGQRSGSRQVTLPGSEHDTFEPPARQAVEEFLKANTEQ
uniref:Dienelactone hydrolase domain-containing protein n=1 Tax=Dechloromonas aromatica (strain RCB) TaxID=159087 RepID=Q47H30_DECAR